MAEEEYSALTLQQLREKLDSSILQLKYNEARNMPLDVVYARISHIIVAMDQAMEKHKGTPAYDQYQQERKYIRELPILSRSNFSRQ